MSLNTWLSANLSAEKLRLQDRKKSRTILLEERGKFVDMAVRIVGAPPTVTTIRLDEVGHLSALTRKWLKHICDYLLVAQLDDRYYVLFVELKQTLQGDPRHREQLRRSLPLLHYLVSAFEVDSDLQIPESRIVVQYLLIAQQSSPKWDKQTVKFDRESVFETEEYRSLKIRKSVAQAIPFQELLKD